MTEQGCPAALDGIVRALAAAGKALRLYPSSSPMQRQSVDAAEQALSAHFREDSTALTFSVGRDGFTFGGSPIAAAVPGARELADALRDHAVATLTILPGCTADDLLTFLGAAMTQAHEASVAGGLAGALAAAQLESIQITDVRLAVAPEGADGGQVVDDFLRELIRDENGLAAWFASASGKEPTAFEEGLAELVRVSGPDGLPVLLQSLSGAFLQQGPDGKDAFLRLSLESGMTRNLAAELFRQMPSTEIAHAIVDGAFGKNMLSVSAALAELPLEDITSTVRAEVQAMLVSQGRSKQQVAFLEHMLDARSRTGTEPALVDADMTFRTVADATRLPDEAIAAARDAVSALQGKVTPTAVEMMLDMLHQAKSFELCCSSVKQLASAIPRLISQGDIALASRVVHELGAADPTRDERWPLLAARRDDALAIAASPESASALISAVRADAALKSVARDFVRSLGDAGPRAVVGYAVTLDATAMALTEELVGRRTVDILNERAASAPRSELRSIVTRLALEDDPRSTSTLESLLRRPDEMARQEVVAGLRDARDETVVPLLARATRDPSSNVQIAAVRALVTYGGGEVTALLCARLAELDVDDRDFDVGKEIIGALAHCPGRAATNALGKLASRHALIKRGRFAEVQALVKAARAARVRDGGAA